MSVKAIGSKYAKNTYYLYVLICMVMGIWFCYDGWFGEYRNIELDKNNGSATPNLYLNQFLIIPLTLLSIWFFISAKKVSSLVAETTDDGLIINGKGLIAYKDFVHIEDRFKTKGVVIVAYKEDGMQKEIKLHDRQYDNLGLLRDALIRKTNAATENNNDPVAPDESKG